MEDEKDRDDEEIKVDKLEHSPESLRCQLTATQQLLGERTAERDAALDRVDQLLALVSALTAERDAARDNWDLAEADADDWEQSAKDFIAERDAARAEVTRLGSALLLSDAYVERKAIVSWLSAQQYGMTAAAIERGEHHADRVPR